MSKHVKSNAGALTPIVISSQLTQPWKAQHPDGLTSVPPRIPQVVAKNHVTSQQLGNALQTLADCSDNALFDVHVYNGSRLERKRIQCKQCGYEYTDLDMRIIQKDSKSYQYFSLGSIHKMAHLASWTDPSTVKFLGLKPGVCYFPTYKWGLVWERVAESHHWDSVSSCMTRLYGHEDKDVEVTVYDVVNQGPYCGRYLAVEAATTKHQLIVEGYPCQAHTTSVLYRLKWKRGVVPQPWFSSNVDL